MNFSSRTRLVAPLALAAGLAFSLPSHAALTATGVSCSGQGTGMTSLAGFEACSGAWSGNNSNQSADVDAQILADWGLTVTGSLDVTPSGKLGSSGTLSFAQQSGPFVIALKAGNAFSLYEFDASTTPISSIHFDTLGVGFFSGGKHPVEHFGQALSHADIYSVSSVVPEPASVALMLAGLGLLGFASSRRRI